MSTPLMSRESQVVRAWQCRKRNGVVVPFDPDKIRVALLGSFNDTPTTERPADMMKEIESIVDTILRNLTSTPDPVTVGVEHIQRLAIQQLWTRSLFATAERYQNYREERRKVRDRETAPVFTQRRALKPYEYPDVLRFADAITESMWTFKHWDYQSDVQDFRANLTPAHRHIVRNALLAISQVEVAVKMFWVRLGDRFRKPEFAFVGVNFGECEARHARAYSHLLETLHLNDEFDKISEVPAIQGRIDYLSEALRTTPEESDRDYILTLALFALFVENVSLFGQFYVVQSFHKHLAVLKDVDNVIQATRKEECYAAGTEILTPTGWRDLKDVKVGDLVLQYNDRRLETVAVTHKVENDHSGDMVRFFAEGVDCLVTPNHDMVFYNTLGELKRRKAIDFRPHSKQKLPKCGRLVGGSVTHITDEDRLRIALQADGSTLWWKNKAGETKLRGTDGGVTHAISLTKERKKVRLDGILNRLGLPYTKKDTDAGKTIYRITYNQDHDYKTFDWVDFSDKTAEWCEEFVMETTHWDGFPLTESEAWGYSNGHKESVDKVHAAAVLAGFRTGVYRRVDDRSETFSDNYKVTFRRRPYEVHAHGLDKEVIPYEGKVYCVTVPSGVIVTRRNDMVMIAGNCLHALFGIELINIVRSQRPEWFDAAFYAKVYSACRKAHAAESRIVDWILEPGAPEFLPKNSVMALIESRFNDGLKAIGGAEMFAVDSAALAHARWFIEEEHAEVSTDFFHKRPVTYAIGTQAVTADSLFD